MIWNFKLPLLLRGKIFWKIWQILWNQLKIWLAPIIARQNFGKNKAILLKWFEYLNCPYYHKLKFSQKQGSFVKLIRKFELPLFWRASIFSIKRDLWYHLKIWTVPTNTRWNFYENVSYLIKPFKHLNFPHIHEA